MLQLRNGIAEELELAARYSNAALSVRAITRSNGPFYEIDRRDRDRGLVRVRVVACLHDRLRGFYPKIFHVENRQRSEWT